MEQIPLSMGLSLRAAEFIALLNPRRGETAIYQKRKTVFPSCCSPLTQKKTMSFLEEPQIGLCSRFPERGTKLDSVLTCCSLRCPRHPGSHPPCPASPASPAHHCHPLQSSQALHRNTRVVNVNVPRSIMPYEAKR